MRLAWINFPSLGFSFSTTADVAFIMTSDSTGWDGEETIDKDPEAQQQ